MNNKVRNPEGFFGTLGDGASDQDYRLGGSLALPIPRHIFETSGKIQYDQSAQRNPKTNMACTIFSAMGCISDQTTHVFSEEEIRELTLEAIQKGFNPSKGWYLQSAVKLCVQYYTAKYEPLLYFRVDLTKADAMYALEQGYTIQVGYNGNSNYNLDFQEDGDLDETSFGKSTYGHAIRNLTEMGSLRMVDNYFKVSNKHNSYTVPKENFPLLLKNGAFFPYGYVVCYKKDFNEMNTNVNVPLWGTKAYQAAQAAIKAGKLIDGGIDDVVGNAALEEDIIKLGIFNTKNGNVSRLRWWEYLRRTNQI